MTYSDLPVPAKLSACIIAFNEEDRIGECIGSLSFCDEVLVVDSHSQDRTREIAAAAGARVIERDWPGHVEQKEFTIREASHDWVVCVDADERIDEEQGFFRHRQAKSTAIRRSTRSRRDTGGT